MASDRRQKEKVIKRWRKEKERGACSNRDFSKTENQLNQKQENYFSSFVFPSLCLTRLFRIFVRLFIHWFRLKCAHSHSNLSISFHKYFYSSSSSSSLPSWYVCMYKCSKCTNRPVTTSLKWKKTKCVSSL